MRHDHIVPLPRQAAALLGELQSLTGRGHYVFPSPARQKTLHLHRDALSKPLREMGFKGKHATHGFRGMLRTVGRERLGIDIDVLEAHEATYKRPMTGQLSTTTVAMLCRSGRTTSTNYAERRRQGARSIETTVPPASRTLVSLLPRCTDFFSYGFNAVLYLELLVVFRLFRQRIQSAPKRLPLPLREIPDNRHDSLRHAVLITSCADVFTGSLQV